MSITMVADGDIFEQDVDSLVNPVNCRGVMGGGLAWEFKNRFPGMYSDYKNRCVRGLLRPGRVDLWKDPFLINEVRSIINFPTKDDHRNPSQLSWIASGMKDLVRVIHIYDIQSIAIPALGCGLGGLDWDDVSRIMLRELADHVPPNKNVRILCPYG